MKKKLNLVLQWNTDISSKSFLKFLNYFAQRRAISAFSLGTSHTFLFIGRNISGFWQFNSISRKK